MKKLFKLLFVSAIALAISFSSYGQETVYCIADLNVNPNPINSYGVTGNTLNYQTQQGVPDVSGGAVGLAMDEANGVLFVCYEFSDVINMLDAVTMQTLGSTTAPGAADLSGLAFDPVNSKLYATDRSTGHFYSFSWTFAGYVLTNDYGGTYHQLPGLSVCWDIALDHLAGILYCGNTADNSIKYYSVTDFNTLAGSYAIGHPPVGLDIDIPNQILYSTGGFYASTLSKYVIGGSETMYNPGGDSPSLGVAVNQSSGLLYMTFYGGGTYSDNLTVFDPTGTGTITWFSGDIGNPTAVLYTGQGFNPLALTVTPSAPCFSTGQNYTCTLGYVNGNPGAVTNVVMTYTPSPNTTFVSASGGGVWDGTMVTWTIGSVAQGAGGSETVTVTIDSGETVNCAATITSTETGLVTVNEEGEKCVGVPISDWAIYLLIGLIGIAILFRYKREIA